MIMSVILIITGLAGLCQTNASGIKEKEHSTAQTTQKPIVDRDDGAGLSFEEDKPRLARFADEVKRNNSADAYIIAYGGLVSYKNEARIRLRCIRDYLITTHKISRSRLRLIDGGYRPEVSVQLFLVKPKDAKPTPFPIVNREAVRIRKAPKYPCGEAIGQP
jgi:hypothetical protein